MHPVQSLVYSENREKNGWKTEHDGNVPNEQVGGHGIGDKKSAETENHKKIEKVTADYITRQDFCLPLAYSRKAWG